MPKFKVKVLVDGRVLNLSVEAPSKNEAEIFVKKKAAEGRIQAPRKQGLLQSLKEDVPEIAGATVGEIAGGATGGALLGPPGITPGTFIGSFLGGATGNLAEQIAERAGDIPKRVGAELGLGRRPTFTEAELPSTKPVSLREAAFAGGKEMLGTGIGKGIFRIGGKFLAPFKSTLTKGVDEVIGTLREFGGAGLTAAQRTGSKFLDFIDTVSRSGFFSADMLARFDQANFEAVKRFSTKVADSMTDKFSSLSDEQFGFFVRNVFETAQDTAKGLEAKLYSHVDELVDAQSRTVSGIKAIPGLQPRSGHISTGSMKKFAKRKIDDFARIRGIGVTSKETSELGKVLDLPEFIRFEDAALIRSEIFSTVRALKGSTSPDKKAIALLSELAGVTDNAIEKEARALGGDVLDAYRKANSFFKTNREVFEDRFVANLINQDKRAVQKIGDDMFRAGNVEEIGKIKNAVKRASDLDKSISFDETWGQIKGQYVGNLFGDAMNRETGEFNLKVIERHLVDRKKLRTLQSVLEPEDVRQLQKLVRVGKFVTDKSKSSGGVFGLAQIAKLSEAAGGILLLKGFSLPAIGFLSAPLVLGKVMTNQRTAKLLTEGIALPAGSEALLQIFSRIGVEVADDIIRDEERRNR